MPSIPLWVPSWIFCDNGDRNPLHSSLPGSALILKPGRKIYSRLAVQKYHQMCHIQYILWAPPWRWTWRTPPPRSPSVPPIWKSPAKDGSWWLQMAQSENGGKGFSELHLSFAPLFNRWSLPAYFSAILVGCSYLEEEKFNPFISFLTKCLTQLLEKVIGQYCC